MKPANIETAQTAYSCQEGLRQRSRPFANSSALCLPNGNGQDNKGVFLFDNQPSERPAERNNAPLAHEFPTINRLMPRNWSSFICLGPAQSFSQPVDKPTIGVDDSDIRITCSSYGNCSFSVHDSSEVRPLGWRHAFLRHQYRRSMWGHWGLRGSNCHAPSVRFSLCETFTRKAIGEFAVLPVKPNGKVRHRLEFPASNASFHTRNNNIPSRNTQDKSGHVGCPRYLVATATRTRGLDRAKEGGGAPPCMTACKS